MSKFEESIFNVNYLDSDEHHKTMKLIAQKINEGYIVRGSKINTELFTINYVLQKKKDEKFKL